MVKLLKTPWLISDGIVFFKGQDRVDMMAQIELSIFYKGNELNARTN